jgi:enoyl-CoA hydratase
MSYNNILVAKENSIATITINKSYKAKCIKTVTIKELHQAFEELEKNYETQ